MPVDSADELGEAATSFNSLVETLATSHRISDAITSLSEALAAHLELDVLAASTLRELSTRTGCEAAALVIVRNGRVDIAGSHGIRDAERLLTEDAVLAALRSADATVLHLPTGLVVSGSLVDFIPHEVRVLPVCFGVLTVGVLVMAFARPSLPEHQAVVHATLPGLAVALNNVLNHEDLQRVAAIDPLTGVYNRRFGLQRLTEEFGRALRSGDPLGLLILDLDHFKDVNDTYGHLVGDRVLQSVVRASRQVLREGDVLLRYGGEEFIVLLPGAGREDVMQMAERVRRAVFDAEIIESGQRIHATISVGGAAFPRQGISNSTEFIGVADVALYAAKEAGRDRCIIA